jgi:hypothetical protein
MAASGRHKGNGGSHIIGTPCPRDKRKSLCVQGIGRSMGVGMPFALPGGTGSGESPRTSPQKAKDIDIVTGRVCRGNANAMLSQRRRERPARVR